MAEKGIKPVDHIPQGVKYLCVYAYMYVCAHMCMYVCAYIIHIFITRTGAFCRVSLGIPGQFA